MNSSDQVTNPNKKRQQPKKKTMDNMRTFSVDYPETIPPVINVSPETFEKEAKMAMAVNYLSLEG